jgi:hypothetical protein
MNALVSNAAGYRDSSSQDNSTTPVVCLSNIGPREQRRRFVFGLVAFAVGIAIAALLILTGVAVWWRVFLFVPFASAGIGYFQARDKT